MGKYIDQAKVRDVKHDGSEDVECIVIDGEKLDSEEAAGGFWDEFCEEGWTVVGGGPKREEVTIFRRSPRQG